MERPLWASVRQNAVRHLATDMAIRAKIPQQLNVTGVHLRSVEDEEGSGGPRGSLKRERLQCVGKPLDPILAIHTTPVLHCGLLTIVERHGKAGALNLRDVKHGGSKWLAVRFEAIPRAHHRQGQDSIRLHKAVADGSTKSTVGA